MVATKARATKANDSEMYNLICKEEFKRLHDTLEEQRDDTAKIKGKVFNGFDDSIKDLRERVNGLRAMIYGLYATVIGTVLLVLLQRFLIK